MNISGQLRQFTLSQLTGNRHGEACCCYWLARKIAYPANGIGYTGTTCKTAAVAQSRAQDKIAPE